MLISTTIMLLLWILGLATVPVLVLSITNKSSLGAKALLVITIFIPVFVITLYYLSDALCVGLPLAIVIYFMFAIVFALIDLAALIINCVRMRKLRKGDKLAPVLTGMLAFILIPVTWISVVCIGQSIILSQSKLVVQCCSRGNGGIGDYDDFIYAYDGNKITLLDLGSEYNLDKFVPRGMVKSPDNNMAGDYTVEMNDEGILIYENGSLVAEHTFEPGYFNVNIESLYS